MSPEATRETLRDYVRAHAVATDYVPHTPAAIARRTSAGEDFFFCLREFLDDLSWADSAEQRAGLINEPPGVTAERQHGAFLGALAEHVAALDGRQPPPWSREPERFLPRWWFPAQERAVIPLALVESPAAFRRRGIFIAASLLTRV